MEKEGDCGETEGGERDNGRCIWAPCVSRGREAKKVGGVKDKTGRSWIKNVLFSFFPTRAEDHRRHGCQRKWCVGMKGADGTKKRRMSLLCRSLSR